PPLRSGGGTFPHAPQGELILARSHPDPPTSSAGGTDPGPLTSGPSPHASHGGLILALAREVGVLGTTAPYLPPSLRSAAGTFPLHFVQGDKGGMARG